jgi:hypothetical protein
MEREKGKERRDLLVVFFFFWRVVVVSPYAYGCSNMRE